MKNTHLKISSNAPGKSPALPKRILVPVDFSPLSTQAVEYARSFASQLRAQVSIIHVVEAFPIDYVVGHEASKISKRYLFKESRTRVRLIARLFANANRTAADSCVAFGKPYREIVKAAKEWDADLILLSTHGRTGWKRIQLGSTADAVVRHAPCPVLTVPAQSKKGRKRKVPELKLKRIIVPIDFSKTSAQALPYAGAAAERFGAELILLHVIAPVPLPLPLYVRRKLRDSAGGLAEFSMDARLSRLCEEVFDKAIPSRTLVRTGVPSNEITKAASSQKADLIILTTHGYTGLKHALLGSTAERVVRYAPCPVLVVRKPPKYRKSPSRSQSASKQKR